CRDGFVESRKDPLLADRLSYVVSIHVGSKVGTNARKDDADPSARQFVEQIAHRLRSRVIDIRDCAGVNDEPTDRGWSAIQESEDLVGEAVSICEEQIGTEAIDNKP